MQKQKLTVRGIHLLSHHRQKNSLSFFPFFLLTPLTFFDFYLPLQVVTFSACTVSESSTLNKGFIVQQSDFPATIAGWPQSWMPHGSWLKELPSRSLVLSDILPIVQRLLSHLRQSVKPMQTSLTALLQQEWDIHCF